MNIEEAYLAMKAKGWGFTRIGSYVGIGPMNDGIVDVVGMDIDPVKAVQKALVLFDGESK